MKPSKSAPPRPTQAELEILRVLWQRGPSSVREVYRTISEARATGYTTVLKLLQIMARKGLVARDEHASHQALAVPPASPDEMDEIRRMLDKAQRRSS